MLYDCRTEDRYLTAFYLPSSRVESFHSGCHGIASLARPKRSQQGGSSCSIGVILGDQIEAGEGFGAGGGVLGGEGGWGGLGKCRAGGGGGLGGGGGWGGGRGQRSVGLAVGGGRPGQQQPDGA